MKKIALAVVMGSIAVSASAVTWSNGSLVTHSLGDRDLSAVSADSRGSTRGLSVYKGGLSPGPYSVADDFMVGSSPILVSQVMVYAYHFQATTADLDMAFVRIWQGTPDSDTPTLVYGDFVNNRRTATDWVTTANSKPLYRTLTGTNTTDTTRRIQQVSIGLGGGVALEANTRYWVEWAVDVSNTSELGSGNVAAPLIALSNTNSEGPNGLVHYENGIPTDGGLVGSSNWGAAALNNSSPDTVAASKVDIPFGLEYQAVPEPGTMIAVGAGLVALAARRRRKA